MTYMKNKKFIKSTAETNRIRRIALKMYKNLKKTVGKDKAISEVMSYIYKSNIRYYMKG